MQIMSIAPMPSYHSAYFSLVRAKVWTLEMAASRDGRLLIHPPVHRRVAAREGEGGRKGG